MAADGSWLALALPLTLPLPLPLPLPLNLTLTLTLTRSHSYEEFQTLLEALRTENATIARGASKVSAAIEALLVFEEVGDIEEI